MALGTAIFALSVMVKYHAILLLPLVYLSPLQTPTRERAIRFLIAGAASLTAFILYNIAVHTAYGFWLTSPQFQKEHGLNLADWPANVVRYGGYLAGLGLPFSISKSVTKVWWIPIAVVAFAVGYFFLPNSGEMGFGPFDAWISPATANGAIAICFAAFVSSLIANVSSGPKRSIALGIVIFIICLSLSRPAQRYLLFILPFYYLLLLDGPPSKRLWIPIVILFCVLDAAVGFHQMGYF